MEKKTVWKKSVSVLIISVILSAAVYASDNLKNFQWIRTEIIF